MVLEKPDVVHACGTTSSGLVSCILSIVSDPQAKPNESVLWRGFNRSVSANNDLVIFMQWIISFEAGISFFYLSGFGKRKNDLI